MLKALARVVATSLYCRQRQYITLKRLNTPDTAPARRPPDIDVLIVDSLAKLEAVAAEIPPSFRDSVRELGRRVARGCVLCLARRLRADGTGKEVVGYELAERGVFSALGRRKAVSANVVFSHHCEVLPAWRGQRIHGLLFATRDAYFRRRGGTVVCGVVRPENQASRKALRRDGAEIVGMVERIALLRVLQVWETPFERVEDALHLAGGSAARRYRGDVRDEFEVVQALLG